MINERRHFELSADTASVFLIPRQTAPSPYWIICRRAVFLVLVDRIRPYTALILVIYLSFNLETNI